jgi:hypothetical protein
MGNCVRRETGLDIDEKPNQEDQTTQEILNKVLSMKMAWKNRSEKNDMHRSALITRNHIITEIDLSDMDDSTKTKNSATSKKSLSNFKSIYFLTKKSLMKSL